RPVGGQPSLAVAAARGRPQLHRPGAPRWPGALGVPDQVVALDVDRRPVGRAAVDRVQLVVEPAVQPVQPGVDAQVHRVAVPALVQPEPALDAVLAQLLPEPERLVGLDVPVVQPVRQEDAGGEVAGGPPVVALRPEPVEVAALPVLALGDLVDDRPAHLVVGAGVDDLGQYVGVLALVAAGGDHPAAGPVVVVPGGDGALRHDGAQPLHAAARRGHRQRAVVGDAGHRDVPGGPVVRGDLLAVRGVPGDPAVQPVHGGGDALRLVLPAAGRAAGGVAAAQAV